MNIHRISTLTFCLRCCMIVSALLMVTQTAHSHNGNYYYKASAQKGDTPQKLLQRYQLHTHKCNLEKFLSVNGVSTETVLIKDKKYEMPIWIVQYDGKSIRSTLGLKDNDWAKALRIKKYNELLLEKLLRSQTLVKSRILWVPYHELHCEGEGIAPVLPKADQTVATHVSGTRDFPIFGSKYQQVPLKDNRLRGRVYYIVAGHGGPDPGAVGHRAGHQLCEDEYAYDVCLRLTRRLLEHGATPYMIIRDPDDGLRDELYLPCDEDEYCWGGHIIPRSQRTRLRQRAAVINDLYTKNEEAGVIHQYVITVHVDSRSRGERTDVFFYHHPSSSLGKKLAKHMQHALKQNYKKYRAYHGTVTARDLHMLREVKPPSVFIELGNIRHPIDQLRFTKKSNRQYLADWLFEGILAWE